MRFVDAFPLTPTEKIQKVELRERIATELAGAGITEAPKLTPANRATPATLRR